MLCTASRRAVATICTRSLVASSSRLALPVGAAPSLRHPGALLRTSPCLVRAEGIRRYAQATLHPPSSAQHSSAPPPPPPSLAASKAASSALSSNFFEPSVHLASLSSSSFDLTSQAQQLQANLRKHAPPSDDPTRAPLSGPLSLPSTPSAALAAGYRPVPVLTPRALKKTYVALGKANLTFLVTLTGMAGYALCPSSLAVSSGPLTLLALAVGTAASSACANSINQLLEAPYDAQMPRTRGRPLPSRAVTPLHAASYAAVLGTSGVTLLALAINPLTGALGLLNIILYAFIYTPLKRVHIINTWIGSLVGALPPLMGWAAATNSLLSPTDAPGWLLATLLFAWQFPHFNALSHNLRADYARGGYRMMSVSHPLLNRRTALRYALACIPLCAALPLTGAVTPLYALLSAPANVALAHAAWKFWRDESDKSAKWCFWVSLVHLPAVMLLAMLCKTGLWDGLLRRLGWKEEKKSVSA